MPVCIDEDREFVVAAKERDRDALQRCALQLHIHTYRTLSCVCSRRLLKGEVDVNCRHPLGWTALHAAVINREHRYIYLPVLLKPK